MTRKEYNGWFNYETWNVKLWLDNEQGSYSEWTDRAEEMYRDAAIAGEYAADGCQAVYDLADELKQSHDDNMPELEASVWSDLLNAALSEVNWAEIAQSYIDDARENGRVYTYHVNLDERGSFYADVRDDAGATIYELKAEGEELQQVTDGFMSDRHDTTGLNIYLEELGVMPKDSELVDAR